MGKLNYLTEEEAKMPLRFSLLQLVLGIQTCKTKGQVVKLLRDAVELGRREVKYGVPGVHKRKQQPHSHKQEKR